MSFLFGNRKQKEKEDLDANYYKRQKAYNDAKEAERERIAAIKGQQDAQAIANRKPFYQKLMGVAASVGKDLIKASGNVNPDVLFNWDEQPKPRRKRRKKRRN